MNEKHLIVYTMGITAPIWNINFCSLTCAWTKSQKWIVMLSYQSQNLLNFSYHFGGDSTLVPSFLWHYLLKWMYLVYTNGLLLVFNLEVMILQLYASTRYCWHSLSFTLASPTPLRQKKIYTIFSMVKNFTHSWEKPSDLSEFEQFIS